MPAVNSRHNFVIFMIAQSHIKQLI